MRDRTIDSLKGFLILCVILGHFPDFGDCFTYIKKSGHIYYFHIPLFLALSTLFVRKISLNYFKKRVTTILLPFIFWINALVILSPANFKYLRLIAGYNLKGVIWGNWHYIRSPLWFFPALFSCNIIFSVLLKLIETKFRRVALITITLLFTIEFIYIEKIAQLHVYGRIPYSLDLAIFLLPYLFSIRYSYNLILKYRTKIHVNYQTIITLISMAVAYISVALINKFEVLKTVSNFHHKIDFAQLSVPYTVIGYLSMVALSIAILVFFMFGRINILWKVGQKSLPIFLLHEIILSNLFRVASYIGINRSHELLKFILGTSFIIAACYIPMLISTILRKYLKQNAIYIGF